MVTLDIIPALPTTKHGNDVIIVFTEKLTKPIKCVPDKTTIDGPGCAKIFFEHVFRHHGLPKVIISDRDPRFTSTFWKTLFSLTGTRLNMSTSNHPQTDGQTERVNKVVEEMLRAYVTPHHDDWDEYLGAVEFAFNDSEHASTGYTPFFLNAGQHPVTPLSFTSETHHATTPANEEAEEFVKRLMTHTERAKELLKTAQGDKVMLATAHFMNIPSVANAKRKLGPRYYGPYVITEVVTPVAMRLDLPASMDIHPVIHESKLQPYLDGAESFPSRVEPAPPPPLQVDDEKFYEIEALRNHRFVRGKLQFYVKWVGYTEEHNEWRPYDDLRDDMKSKLVKQLVSDYRQSRQLPKEFMVSPPPRKVAVTTSPISDPASVHDTFQAPYKPRQR